MRRVKKGVLVLSVLAALAAALCGYVLFGRGGGAGQVAVGNPVTVDELVGKIVNHAAADDTGFFAKYLDSSSKGQEKQLIEQIKASGMANNYKTHLEDIAEAKPATDRLRWLTEARLNYHGLGDFQIDLEKQNGSWIIKGIWFCR